MQEDDFAEYTNGPEQIIPVNNAIIWKPHGAVKLKRCIHTLVKHD